MNANISGGNHCHKDAELDRSQDDGSVLWAEGKCEAEITAIHLSEAINSTTAHLVSSELQVSNISPFATYYDYVTLHLDQIRILSLLGDFCDS